MFTDKEAKEFLKLINQESEGLKDPTDCCSITQLVKHLPEIIKASLEDEKAEDVEIPSITLSNVVLPDWLPLNIQQKVQEHIELIEKYKDDKVMELICDFYGYEVLKFKRLLPVFTKTIMKDIWLALDKISSEKTEKFAFCLLQIESDFNIALKMYYKHKDEKKCFNQILEKIEETKKLMEKYQCHFYGHMLTDEFLDLQKSLMKFEESSQNELQNFEAETKDITYLFSDLLPINREFKAENALPIFYIRKISLYFRTEYKKPYNEYVETIVNTIFKTSYIDNEITKITKPIKKFLKSDNSAIKK